MNNLCFLRCLIENEKYFVNSKKSDKIEKNITDHLDAMTNPELIFLRKLDLYLFEFYGTDDLKECRKCKNV